MSLLPKFLRLEASTKWQDAVGILNDFMRDTLRLLDGRVSLDKHTNSQISMAVITGGTVLKITTRFRQPPIGVVLLDLREHASGATFTAATHVEWDATSDNGVSIKSIAGLYAGVVYDAVLLIVGGEYG